MSGRQARKRRGEETKRYVRGFLESHIRVLRGILKRRAPTLPADVRSPCHTCAFNPSTDTWLGFETTVLGLLEAIEGGRSFYCHEGLPTDENGAWYWDPKQGTVSGLTLPPVCAGWRAIADDPATRTAGQAAVRALPSAPRQLRRRFRRKAEPI